MKIFFDAVVEEVHPALGTMTCRVAGTDLLLESPLANKAAGEAACLALRAGDILVATSRPSGISAQKPAAVAGSVRLRIAPGWLNCASGVRGRGDAAQRARRLRFCVHITRGALQNLGLETEQAVWLIIKTHSIQFLRS